MPKARGCGVAESATASPGCGSATGPAAPHERSRDARCEWDRACLRGSRHERFAASFIDAVRDRARDRVRGPRPMPRPREAVECAAIACQTASSSAGTPSPVAADTGNSGNPRPAARLRRCSSRAGSSSASILFAATTIGLSFNCSPEASRPGKSASSRMMTSKSLIGSRPLDDDTSTRWTSTLVRSRWLRNRWPRP